MKIATIAALALTLALPSLAQQSATKIVTENGQPTLALDEQFAARLRSGRTEQNAPATVPSEFSAAAPGLPLPADANHAAVKETAEERNRRMEWWRDAKFGMFIHYGLYSGLAGEWKGKPGGSEWIQKNVEVDTDSYAAEALPLFKPKEGLTEEWARLARDAGCQYVVLTSKHHEGFGLFDSAQTDYDAKSAVNRDIIREYVDSCRKRGLKVGLYHSVIDWHHPSYDNTICPDLCYPAGQAEMLKRKNIPRDHAAYQKYLHAQVRELMTRYAPIDIMWWDYSQGLESAGTDGHGALHQSRRHHEQPPVRLFRPEPGPGRHAGPALRGLHHPGTLHPPARLSRRGLGILHDGKRQMGLQPV